MRTQVWPASALAAPLGRVRPSGFEALDRELPGGGWPCGAVTEILQAQPAVLEWRLLAPSLRDAMSSGLPVVVIAPPRQPHLPGLRHAGIDERQLVWVRAETPAERLWAIEQLLRTDRCGAIVAWLDHARADQIRRLQVRAADAPYPVFLCRPAAAQRESSAAPLRMLASFGVDWTVHVQILKRRGAAHDGVIELESVPGGLDAVLTPRLRQPSRWIATREGASDAVGRPALTSGRPVTS
ncbi:MAG: translesion DNA synthesis-associated protein ImuA [Burkholderiaceae bacterium]